EFAAVENICAAGGDLFEGSCMIRKADHFGALRGTSFGEEHAAEFRELLSNFETVSPCAGNCGADEEAVTRIGDGICKKIGERKFAEAAGYSFPCGDGTGNGDSIPADEGHIAFRREVPSLPCAGGFSRGVQAVE